MGQTEIAHALRADRVRAGHQVVEKDTQTVDVTLDGGVAPGKDLRRQIEGRSGDLRAAVVRKLSSRAKVHQHGSAVVGEHHVLCLDISMQHAGAVHCRNGMTKVDADLNGFRTAEHFASVHDLFERAAPDELHPETDACADLLGAVDRDDVRMTDAGEQSAFVDDGRGGTVADGWIRVDQLERHLAIEPRVPRPVHLAEDAAADSLERAQVSPVRQRAAAIAGCRRRDRVVVR